MIKIVIKILIMITISWQGRVLLGKAQGRAQYYGAGTKKILFQILFAITNISIIIIIVVIYIFILRHQDDKSASCEICEIGLKSRTSSFQLFWGFAEIFCRNSFSTRWTLVEFCSSS